jgi:hypothetical protein
VKLAVFAEHGQLAGPNAGIFAALGDAKRWLWVETLALGGVCFQVGESGHSDTAPRG